MLETTQGFIHTFSLESEISEAAFIRLKEVYVKDKEFFYNSTQNRWVLQSYAYNGVRIEIYEYNAADKRYNGKKGKKRALIYVNMYKLLKPGTKYGAVGSIEDITEAYKKLLCIIEDIYFKTGVDLAEKVDINRMDVTIDVVTPDDIFSREIIRISELVQLKKGFHHWVPKKDAENYNPLWKEENATFFFNHNQGIEAKMYLKSSDPEIVEQLPEEIIGKSLLRFELALQQDFFRLNEYYTGKFDMGRVLLAILVRITKDAKELLKTYLFAVLDTGDILSGAYLKRVIDGKTGSKVAKKEKMLKYVDYINGVGNCEEYCVSKKTKESFKEFGISPFYSNVGPYIIPSFSKILENCYDEQQFLKSWVKAL